MVKHTWTIRRQCFWPFWGVGTSKVKLSIRNERFRLISEISELLIWAGKNVFWFALLRRGEWNLPFFKLDHCEHYFCFMIVQSILLAMARLQNTRIIAYSHSSAIAYARDLFHKRLLTPQISICRTIIACMLSFLNPFKTKAVII